jgi:hypothetical protein
MFKKTERMVVDVGINPRAVPPRLFLPIVENASMQDDEDLHTIRLMSTSSSNLPLFRSAEE